MGAANAMHDAIALANRINGLPFHPVAEEIEAAFKAYKEERIDWVEKAFDHSKVFRTMAGQVQEGLLALYSMRKSLCCARQDDQRLIPFSFSSWSTSNMHNSLSRPR